MTETLEHTWATEALIVLSQTFFFIMLFLTMKYGIIERQGWLENREKAKEHLIPLITIYIAILGIIGIIMIPLQNYEYGHVVLLTTMISISVIFAYEFRKLYYGNNSDGKQKESTIDNVSRKIFIRNNSAVNKKDKITKPQIKRSSNPQPSDGFDF